MTYSSAPRCPGPACDSRAVLDRQVARRLSLVSDGRLDTFECPEGLGTHVWNPDFERGEDFVDN